MAEKSYYFETFKAASGNLRQTWRLLNNLMGGASFENSPDSFNVNGTTITNKSEIVENFNKYFVDIGSRLAASILPVPVHFADYLKNSYKDSFVFYPTDPAEIFSIVSNFDNKSSAGHDDIPVKIMKASIHAIAHPISAVIKQSLRTGVFPDALKIARVCPIFKSGDMSDFLNYRPISILPSFSKIYEKVVFNRLLAYLDSKHILCDSQYGFRRNHSTYMSLIDLYDRISVAIDKREFSIGVFIDLSKAFDTLDHSILLRKLEHYGVRGVALQWFNSYLSNRKQCVTLNGATSSIQNIIYGVPQGSILGPLLFILYINDIVNCSDLLSFILFADDTTLVFSCKNLLQLNQTINVELAKVSDWLKANKLSLNTKKTNFILFGNKHTRSGTKFNIMIDGYSIEQVDNAKFLGVFVDDKLNWKKHIDYIALKISRGLAVMGRLRNTLPRNALLMLYYTMIYPYLTYCNLIWGSASATALRRLVCLQKRALRLITLSTFRSPSNPLFVSLKLLKLFDINIYQNAQFMFKVKHCLLPVSCLRYVSVTDSKRYYETRNVHFFSMVGFRTVIRENGISIRGPRIWDSLTKEIQESNSLVSFKRRLLKHLVASYETLNQSH
ncbi:RNA-directed DNA polymerase [Flavobacterium sp.]|uniref:RNA-directed DNA polymerase n=1 Tax=Flavobacterium sp. TaxID=239 RepID=UPI0038FBFD24